MKKQKSRNPKSQYCWKVGNTTENVLNEIRQIIYALYWAKEVTTSKKSIQQYNEFNKGIIQKWTLYLRILKIVKHLILKDYHPILLIK